MMGQQNYQPKLFAMIQMEELIPKNHLLRQIDKILDLSFVREMVKELYCSNNGRPSIDPELFVRMLILTFVYNIKSDRKLCEEIGYNLAYRWFCRLSMEDQVPDHSSITRIRDRLGEKLFKEVFDYVVKLCADNGLVEAKELMMDGSLVPANASLNSLVAKDKVDNNKLEQKKKSKQIKGKTFSNKTHISSSDPDARLTGKVGVPKYLGYKVHNSIDPLARVIVDTHVTSGAELEGNVCFDRLDHVETNFGYQIECLTADRGYGYGENLHELQIRGLHSYVPNFHSDVGGKYERQNFKYKDNGRENVEGGRNF